MRLIQPLKFRTLKTGCFKMPRLQTVVFQMGITIASGHSDLDLTTSVPLGKHQALTNLSNNVLNHPVH